MINSIRDNLNSFGLDVQTALQGSTKSEKRIQAILAIAGQVFAGIGFVMAIGGLSAAAITVVASGGAFLPTFVLLGMVAKAIFLYDCTVVCANVGYNSRSYITSIDNLSGTIAFATGRRIIRNLL